jgi:hypothetical protein
MTEFICGFECGVEGLEMGGLGTHSLISTGPRSGTYCEQVNPTTSGDGSLGPIAPSGSALNFTVPLAMRFGFKVDTLPASLSEEILQYNGWLRINSNGTLALYGGTGTTLVATGTTVLATGTWYTIEVFTPSGIGTQKFRVYPFGQTPGADEFTTTGNFSAANVTIGKVTNRNNQTVNYKYDDIRIKDGVSNYLGDGAIVRIPGVNPATIAPTYNQWTKTGGTLDAIWNVIPVANTGNSANTALNSDQRQTIRHNPTGLTGTINACATKSYGRNGNGLTNLCHITNGNFFDDGLTQNDGGVDRYTGFVWATPSASISELDASEIGVHRSAGTTNTTNIWQAYLEVDYLAPQRTAAGKIQARRKR